MFFLSTALCSDHAVTGLSVSTRTDLKIASHNRIIALSSVRSGKTFFAQEAVGMETTHQVFLLLINRSEYSINADLLTLFALDIRPGSTSFISSGSDADMLKKAAPLLA